MTLMWCCPSKMLRTLLSPLPWVPAWGRVPVQPPLCSLPSCPCPLCSGFASISCLKFLSTAVEAAWDSPALPALWLLPPVLPSSIK